MPQRKTILTVVFVFMSALLVLIVLGDNGWVELTRLRANRDSLIQANEQLTRENMRLYHTIERLQNDLTYIENVARQELGMIRSDELIFKFRVEKKAP